VYRNKASIYDRYGDIIEIEQLIRCYRIGISRAKDSIVVRAVKGMARIFRIKVTEEYTYITIRYKNIRSQLVCTKVKSPYGEHYVAKNLEQIA